LNASKPSRRAPDADKLEIAKVAGTQTLIVKGQFKAGDLCVYFPPDILLPGDVSEALGVAKYLKTALWEGSRFPCRVAACRLRGTPSYGFARTSRQTTWTGRGQKTRVKFNLTQLAKLILVALIGFMATPFIGGAYYSLSGNHAYEQRCLDHYVDYLQELRTNDPELKGILDYTIRRYSRIGAWDVAFIPLIASSGFKTIGYNCPWTPGLTLDTEVLGYSPREGAMVLVHEAAHDYYPYFHPFIDPLMKKIEHL